MMKPLELPDFIDNEDYKLVDVLKQLFSTQSQADIASGYFNLGGYALVKDAIESVPRLRLLLSKEQGGSGLELYPAGFRHDLAKAPLSRANRQFAKALAEFLRRPEVEVRLYTKGSFHGKAYIFGQVAIVGSSNFTQAGLTTNTELNSVHKQGYAVEAVRKWFERFWELSEEYKAQLIQLLEESKLISSTYSPYLVFIKSLYEYFKDELMVDLEKGRDIGKSLVDLSDFQQKAFERALKILEKYDGVFIADSVGLGKTWIGKRLLEHFGYFLRKKCLVVVPAQLKEMWESELRSIQVAADVVSMEQLGRISEPELSRYFDAEVVLVDESHNFRNFNQRYRALSFIMRAGKGKKAIFLTATPINNTVFDLYNQIMLFAKNDYYFVNAGIPHLRSYFIRALADGDLLNLLEEIMIRRTRQFIKREFPDAVINGERVHFPKRELHTVRYNMEAVVPGMYQAIARLFDRLALAVYNPEAFLKEISDEVKQELQRNEALIGLIKTGLLKRFESSVEAFRISLRNHILFHEKFLDELMHGRLLSKGDYQRLQDLEDEGEFINFRQSLPLIHASAYRIFDLAQVVAEDLEVLRAMLRLAEGITPDKDPKVRELIRLIDANRGKKIIVFSYFKDTVRYLERVFKEVYQSQLAGVRWAVIHSDVDFKERHRIIKQFAPRSQKAPTPQAEQLDLLVATDVFSEGQNLQDADTMINFDLHWNPVRMVQRAGRIDRLGSPYEVVHIYNFFPEKGLEQMLRLVSRLSEKIADIDKNVGLDASILGEAVNPKVFNALKRIEAEDESIADELEAESEISSEFMRLVLSAFLQKVGAERIEALPYGIHSGMAGRGRKGVFVHFKIGDEHFWRFYDVEQHTMSDSKYQIFRLIQCDENTERVEADYDIESILNKVKNQLLEELNRRRASSVPELPKLQREITEYLWRVSRHPDIDPKEVLMLLKALKEPLPQILVGELRSIYRSYLGPGAEQNANRDRLFVEALKAFVEKFKLQEDSYPPSLQAKPVEEEDLELVVFLTLA